jgi:hypothetical protein
MGSSPAAVEQLRAALRTVLRLEAGEDAHWRLAPEVSDDEFFAAVRRHLVSGALWAHLDALEMPEGVRTRLIGERDAAAVACLRTLRTAVLVQDELAAHGIDSLVFKGPALALQTTGSATSRGFGDVDLLVAPDSAHRALDILEADGFVIRADNPRDGKSWAARYQLRVYYEASLSRNGVDVDLHWRMDPAVYALPSFEEVWHRHVTVEQEGVALRTLDPLTALMQSCGHAAKDDGRWLRSLIDIARLARHPDLPPDWITHLRPIDKKMLAITADALGGLPHHTWTTSVRQLRRARQAQDTDVPVPGHSRLPPWIEAVRRTTQSSHHPADVVRATALALMPVRTIHHVPDHQWWRALPKALGARGQDLGRKFRARAIRR